MHYFQGSREQTRPLGGLLIGKMIKKNAYSENHGRGVGVLKMSFHENIWTGEMQRLRPWSDVVAP